MELELAIQKLSPQELSEFTTWFEQDISDRWDRRIEQDMEAGWLDDLARKADADFEAGRCNPLRGILRRRISGIIIASSLRTIRQLADKNSSGYSSGIFFATAHEHSFPTGAGR